MRKSISNIAWTSENDDKVLSYLRDIGYDGVEIAPTRCIESKPYDHLDEAQAIKDLYKKSYGLEIASMQSIWYGRSENLFVSNAHRQALLDYTIKALDFAQAIECRNLVFGNPKNRNKEDGPWYWKDLLNSEASVTSNNMNSNMSSLNVSSSNLDPVMEFFYKIAQAAKDKNAVIALEPNPNIYGTNVFNTTRETFAFIEAVNHPNLMMNLDFGALLANDTEIESLGDMIHRVNHVHISEPFLDLIKTRDQHKTLVSILKSKNYMDYVSIEMKGQEDLNEVFQRIDYLDGLVEKNGDR